MPLNKMLSKDSERKNCMCSLTVCVFTVCVEKKMLMREEEEEEEEEGREKHSCDNTTQTTGRGGELAGRRDGWHSQHSVIIITRQRPLG